MLHSIYVAKFFDFSLKMWTLETKHPLENSDLLEQVNIANTSKSELENINIE